MIVRGLFVMLLAGCASQVVIMSRGSSGAVELDSDFQPSEGTDHHYISFPAYPFVNCTDPLIYDRLVDRIYAALANSYKPAPALCGRTERELQAIDLFTTIQGTQIGRLAARTHSADLASYLVKLARGGAAGAGRFVVPDSIKHEVERSAFAALASPSVSEQQREALETTAANDAGDLIDRVLHKSYTAAFTAADLAGFSGDADLGNTLAEIQHLAESYGSTPCSSSLLYHDFLGYAGDAVRDVSWIDRSREQQTTALQALAGEFGLAIAGWPRSHLSFLHFSDVQIREPGAKLGGTQLSSQLRNLEASFEQDYVQELYALYGYAAIVKTATREIQLMSGMQLVSTMAAEVDQRPGPTLMIHTGDSADTGMQSEFDSFITYTNKLPVPWYQVIGNHDVLAFGNLRMSSIPAQLDKLSGRQRDERCQGWDRIPCTCTDLNTLARNQEIRTPDNRGETSNALPSRLFGVVPILLQRICLLHAVASDWFVMDPDKSPPGGRDLNNPVDSFILSHCDGWHPNPAAAGTAKDNDALAQCMRPSNALRERYERYVHRPGPGQLCATLDGDTPPSTMHGFDTLASFDPTRRAGARTTYAQQAKDADAGPVGHVTQTERNALGGYYCFEMQRAAGASGATKLWAIVLNTNTDAGAYGVLLKPQIDWLRELIPAGGCPAGAAGSGQQIGCDDSVMVFSHHPIFAIYDQGQRIDLTEIITSSPNVIAYIAGHTHNAGLRTIRPLRGSPSAHAKWEIIAPSVIDFPQAARQITVKTTGDLGYLEVLTFTPHGTGAAAAKIAAASEGAVRDRCRSAGKCDSEGHALLPPREMTFPRAFFMTPAATRRLDAARRAGTPVASATASSRGVR